ncbi:hypothetical protein B296_00023439 [Ensete ventricosum]|uniref:Uncharacterized protein n=1 Tax=Ensete ventricosum TaxID=4639 RepID=A0A426ZN77_ENSVE|nr:hypothetical protein B296_00023439 [Ensete ventricosum]
MRQWQAVVKKVGWKRQMREERKTVVEGVRLLRQERRKGRPAWQRSETDNREEGVVCNSKESMVYGVASSVGRRLRSPVVTERSPPGMHRPTKKQVLRPVG